MDDSILTSIKKLLHIYENDTSFDADILMHINSTFMILSQLGVGPKGGYKIVDDLSVWDDYISEEDNLESIKTYIYLKVKMVFDPPYQSSLIEAINKEINELEWRLNVEVESNNSEVEND